MTGLLRPGWILIGDWLAAGLLLAVVGCVFMFYEFLGILKWRTLGRELGLQKMSGVFFFKKVTGFKAGFAVTVQSAGTGGQAQIVVNGLGKIPNSLRIEPEKALDVAFWQAKIRIGEPKFDAAVKITGQEEEVLALLDSETRDPLVQAVASGGSTVKDGRICLMLQEMDDAADRLDGLIDLGQRLTLLRMEIPGRLVRNAASDPLPSVRLRNLEALQEKYPDCEDLPDVSRLMLKSEDPELRFAGARSLETEGLPAARELVLSDAAGDDLRRRALEWFLRQASREQISAVMAQLVENPPPALLPLLVEELEQHPLPPLLIQLLAAMDLLSDEMVLALARAAAWRPGGASEEILLRLLGRDNVEIRIEAAKALGQIGTARAVEPLLALTTGLLASPSVKEAAREAVARIQSRLGDAEAGRLSLAVPAEGEGALSLPVEERPGGELSLPPREAISGEPDSNN